MSSSPPKKQQRPIADFFKPYLKSTVPTKRPSPSFDEDGIEVIRVSSRDVSTSTTPTKKEGRKVDRVIGTPRTSSALTPSSVPGSRRSLSIPFRSPRPALPVDPPSTYKRAPRFGADGTKDSPLKPPVQPFSFADAPTPNQAGTSNGQPIEIPDSDDDDTASLDSLESLHDLFGKQRRGNTTSLSSSPGGEDEAKLEAERVRTLSLFTSGRSVPLIGKDKLRTIFAKERAQKFDISGLLGDHFDDEEVEDNVRKARADIEAATKRVDAERNLTLDKKLLAAVATTEDGEDGLARLMDAVDRTEALTSERIFLFFGSRGLNDWRESGPPAQTPFPEKAIPQQLWNAGDHESQSRAFLSGYVAGLAADRLVPDEALRWVFDNAVVEPREDVRTAYIDCLRAASASWTRTNVTAHDVRVVFQTLGADATSTQESVEIQPRYYLTQAQPARRDPKYLLAALDVFEAICQDMDFLALSKLVSVVCRLAIDGELMSDHRVCLKVDHLLEALLSLPDSAMRSHVTERMVADVGHHLKDARLQAALLSHIPPTSSTASRLRVLLAHIFLLGLQPTSQPVEVSLDVLSDHISRSPSFDTKRRRNPQTLDYIALRALTHVLDVAISDGGRPVEFGSLAKEQAFNREVDRLADTVKATFVAIIDTGASHMTRTEAKDVLQALHWRLLYAVRTEVRPKRNIFDGKTGRVRDAEEVRTEEQGRDFMQRFLAKTKEKSRDRGRPASDVKINITPPVDDDDPPGGTTPEEDRPASHIPASSASSSSQISESERLIRQQLNQPH